MNFLTQNLHWKIDSVDTPETKSCIPIKGLTPIPCNAQHCGDLILRNLRFHRAGMPAGSRPFGQILPLKGPIRLLQNLGLKRFQNLFIFLGILLVLSLVYWSALSSRYFFHDDVIYFLRTQIRKGPPGTLFALAMGRFIGAFLFMGISWLVHVVDDLNFVRFLSVVQLSILGLMLTAWMRRHFFNLAESVFLVLILLTLPPFQILACQAGMAQHPASIIFSVASFILAYGLAVSGSLRRRWLCFRALGAVLFFVGSLSVFQPGAMFFWALVGFVVLFEQAKSPALLRQRLENLFAVGIVSLIVYRGILQITQRFFTQFDLYAYNPYGFTTDVIGKMLWYFKEPVFNALNLWNIFAVKFYAVLIVLIIILGVGLSLWRQKKENKSVDVKNVLFKAGVLTVVFFFSSLPNLILPENVAFFRCFMALGALVVFLLVWSGREILCFFSAVKIKELFLICVVCLSVFGMTQAFQTVWAYRVNLSAQETQFFLKFFTREQIEQIERVYIVLPDSQRFRTTTDEFGNLTTFYGHNAFGLVACAVREVSRDFLDVYHILVSHKDNKMLFLFADKGGKEPQYAYEVTVETGTDIKSPFDFHEPTLVIDMTKFRPEPASLYFKPE